MDKVIDVKDQVVGKVGDLQYKAGNLKDQTLTTDKTENVKEKSKTHTESKEKVEESGKGFDKLEKNKEKVVEYQEQ